MRLHAAMIAACYLIVSSPAFSATQKQIDICVGAEVMSERVAACSEIIDNKAEGPYLRAAALSVRGSAYRYMGELDKALKDLNASIDVDPNNYLALDNRAFVWRDKGELDFAIRDFTDSIRLNRESDGRTILAASYSHRGITWQTKGNNDKALADYNESIRIDPKSADLYHRRARFYIETDKLDLAMRDLDATIQRDAEHTDALYLRGALRYERYTNAGASEWVHQSDLDGALADFTEVIRLLPRTASRAFYMRALARKVNGDKDGMIADLIEAYKIDPNDKQVVAILEQVKPDYKVVAEPLNKLLTWEPAVGRRSN